MRTEDMLPIAPLLDEIGFWSIEVWGGATFDACVRFLKEDPWDRLRRLRAAMPNTRLQMLLRGQNLVGYRHYSDDVVRAFVAKAAVNGIDVFRVFDAMNDIRNLRTAIEAVKAAGKHAQGTFCYTTSPVDSIERFVDLAKQLEAMGSDSIAIKDMAGLLTPMVTGRLVQALKAELHVPVYIHSHDSSGQAAMSQLMAVQAGVDNIDTAAPGFAWGTSHPDTASMVAALRGSEYDTRLDIEKVQDIGAYFYEVRKKYHQFESDFTGVDTRVLLNQIPGGMMSNLTLQLRDQGALHLIDEVFAEIPRVRADLGYPPLVTPTSQIVGTQAVLNVLTGERYKTITNEVKLYMQGLYGRPPGVIDEALRRHAIGNEQVIDVRPADLLDPEMAKLREEIGGLAGSDEDVLTYAMFKDVGREFLADRAGGTLRPEPLLPLAGPSRPAASEGVPTEFVVDVHGETYRVDITGMGVQSQGKRRFFISIDGVPEEVVVEPLNEFVSEGPTGRRQATSPGHVTTAMPGNIIDILVGEGEVVRAGQLLLVTEAMKMQSDIQAPVSGTVRHVYVRHGDRVTPGEVLIDIEPDDT
jgi:pyruvate carboxylase subunit B